MTKIEYFGGRSEYGSEDERPDSDVLAALHLYPSKVDKDGNETPGAPKRSLYNLILILRTCRYWRGCVGYDEFSHEITLRPHAQAPWRPLVEADVAKCRSWISKVYGLDYGKDDTFAALEAVAEENPHHAVKEYLRGLCWDGIPRLADWLQRLGGATDTLLAREMGRLWMVGAAKRALEPGCQMDYMLVLQSGQGQKKSTTARILSRSSMNGGPLSPDAYADMPPDIKNKDTWQLMAGSWIVEVGELNSLKKAEASAIKQFLTLTKDRFRPSHARLFRSFPRQCAFIGTVNESNFLTDPTGSRRFWVVELRGRIDAEALAAEIDQLWAEAVVQVDAGVLPYLAEDLDKEREVEAAKYTTVHPWQDFIESWLERPFVQKKLAVEGYVLTEDILVDCLGCPRSAATRAARETIGQIMKTLGFVPARPRVGGAQCRGWALK